MLMQWVFRDPNGEGRGITVMGYDIDERKYFSHTFDERGKVVRFKGVLDADTLILERIDPFERDGAVVGSRYVSRRVSPTHRVFKTEISRDGGPWAAIVEGTATKKDEDV